MIHAGTLGETYGAVQRTEGRGDAEQLDQEMSGMQPALTVNTDGSCG